MKERRGVYLLSGHPFVDDFLFPHLYQSAQLKTRSCYGKLDIDQCG